MLSCRLSVVKFGGSAITIKSRPETINAEALEGLSEQVSKYLSAGGRIVIVHGGGSFGHYAVDRLSRERGRLGPLEVAEVQRSMLRLSEAVLSSLISKGVPAVLHPPHTMCDRACNYEPIERDLREGLAPVTYGDGVLRGGSAVILSGDRLASEIATEIGADCLVFASDVPGVIGPGGVTLKLVRPDSEIADLGQEGVDVTGGIRRKLAEASSSKAKVVRIVHWRDVLRALMGEDVGTLVLPY